MKLIFFVYSLVLSSFSQAANGAKSNKHSSRESEKPILDPLAHDTLILNPGNFDGSISQYRNRFPGAVLYYIRSPSTRKVIENQWEPIAKEMWGMARIGALDCEEYKRFCEKDGIQLSPEKPTVVKLFPPYPFLPETLEGPIDRTKLVVQLKKQIPNCDIESIDEETKMKAVIATAPSVPKVILFAEKAKPSPSFKALCHAFKSNMNFILVSGGPESDLAKKFRVKKFPTLIIKKGGIPNLTIEKSEMYHEDFKNFHKLHKWLNQVSETFVRGGGYATKGDSGEPEDFAVTRPWLFENVPEMTKHSHNEICFKKAKGLCAVYLSSGPLQESIRKNLEDLASQRESLRQQTGGPEFHWSWMNLQAEVNFAKLFHIDSNELGDPQFNSFVIINPHKKIRFSKLPTERTATPDEINAHIEKIVSGDGRFTILKGNQMPAFQGEILQYVLSLISLLNKVRPKPTAKPTEAKQEL